MPVENEVNTYESRGPNSSDTREDISIVEEKTIDNVRKILPLRGLVKSFINNQNGDLDRKLADIFKDKKVFVDFEEWMISGLMSGEIKLPENFNFDDIFGFIKSFKDKYSYHTGRSVILYEAISKRFQLDKGNHKHRQKLLPFNAIYNTLSLIYHRGQPELLEKFDKKIEEVFGKLDSLPYNSLQDIYKDMLSMLEEDFSGNMPTGFLEKIFYDEIGFLCGESQDRLEVNRKEEDCFNEVITEEVFGKLLDGFLVEEKRKDPNCKFEKDDIYTSLAMFRRFEDYCLSLEGSKDTKDECSYEKQEKVLSFFRQFRENNHFGVRNSTEYWYKIQKKLGLSKKEKTILGLSKEEETTFEKIRIFKAAYHLLKFKATGNFRKFPDINGNQIRDFEHPIGTMEVVLDELNKPSFNKIIYAILHDFMEDFDEVNYDFIKFIFGKEISDGLAFLTKRHWKTFLTNRQIKKVERLEKGKSKEQLKKMAKEDKIYKHLISIGKGKRDKDYFGRLNQLANFDNLSEEDKKRNYEILSIKIADRINNLRTLDGLQSVDSSGYVELELNPKQIKSIVNKIIQTENEIIPIARSLKVCIDRSNEYELLINEIRKFKEIPGVLDVYNKIIQ